jgi:hypothetical protein
VRRGTHGEIQRVMQWEIRREMWPR